MTKAKDELTKRKPSWSSQPGCARPDLQPSIRPESGSSLITLAAKSLVSILFDLLIFVIYDDWLARSC